MFIVTEPHQYFLRSVRSETTMLRTTTVTKPLRAKGGGCGKHIFTNLHSDRFRRYISGVITNKGQKLIVINGVEDHLHTLIGLKPKMALADLVQDIKADSSKFINRNKLVHGKFSWQEGYGAFSYGHSQLDSVIRYIQNQKKHHQRRHSKMST